ncbi:hypothetical protein EWM64_g1387 [Hericium alpestre]|uniref:Magnesium transporter protein 1 n=1 Tax=Hericium alpestre TaxID=135208 RepID=A0A4Z0A6H5_9AGAM|nr:hypothetical protein EWM64_g1387 [Hericium alpestre]
MLLPFLLLLALPACILAAKPQNVQERFVNLAQQNDGIIKLDADTFDLLTSPKRNWSTSIQFTALDKRRRCNPCREFEPAWKAVAKAWTAVPKEQRDQHFFATLDFDDGHSVFQKSGTMLQQMVLAYLLPEVDSNCLRLLLVSNMLPCFNPIPTEEAPCRGFDAEPLAEQLSAYTPLPIPYRAPINWALWGSFAVMGLSLILAVRVVAPIFRSRWTWATLVTITSLIMTSGYMFTRIRGMPMTGPNGDWIAQGFQSQYGQETVVVATLYGLLGASFLMLTVVAPRQTSPNRQKIQIYIWTVVIMVLFSVLVSFFRAKNRGYPFKLFI